MKSLVSTRRQFLAASAALPFALRSFAETTAPRWVFLGTDKGAGIFRATWNPATGELGKAELAVATERPNFFAMHPKLPILYTTNSVAEPNAAISAFRVNTARAELTLMDRKNTEGNGPCYVSVDRTGKMAFAANYGGGSFIAYRLGPQGELASVAGTLQCKDNAACGVPGPMKERQDGPYLHCAVVSPNNDFVLACNLGEDAIEVFPIAPGTAKPLGTPMRVPCRPGSGPRHVAFHPNGRWVYCMYEVDSTMDLYDWKVTGGKAAMTPREGSMRSTLKPGTPMTGNTGCELVVSEDGRLIYTCTRGVDEIVVYRVGATGLLTEHQRMSCGGKVPRMLTFDPTRRWLLCSNQGSSTITLFAHDRQTGRLTATGKSFEADTPMFVLWV